MENKKIIEIILPCLLTLGILFWLYFTFNNITIKVEIVCLIICLLINCFIYKHSPFWRNIWFLLKFPFYLYSVAFTLITTMIYIVVFQYFILISYVFLIFALLKFSYFVFDISLSNNLLIYVSLTGSVIIFTCSKKIEYRANESLKKTLEKRRMSKMRNEKLKQNKIYRSFREIGKPLSLIPRYSANDIRSSIYLFYFIALVISNFISEAYFPEWIVEITNSEVVNNSLLTYFAFDSFYARNNVYGNDIKKNALRLFKVVLARNWRLIYPKNNRL